MSVKDAQYPHPVERTLLVSQPMVQIRLSVLGSTIIACLLAIFVAIVSRVMVSRNIYSRSVHLPSSQFDWAVQAAREHNKSREGLTSTRAFSQRAGAYAAQNDDLGFFVSPGHDGKSTVWIGSVAEQAIVQPPYPLYTDPRFTYTYLEKLPDTPTGTPSETV